MHINTFIRTHTIIYLFHFSDLPPSQGKTASSIHDLLALQPRIACLLSPIDPPSNDSSSSQASQPSQESSQQFKEEEIDVSLIQQGDLIKVTPGRIAVDGVVEWGSTYVNEAAMTGDELPVKKEVRMNNVRIGRVNRECGKRVNRDRENRV